MTISSDTLRDKRPNPQYARIFNTEYKHFSAIPKSGRIEAMGVYLCLAHHANNKTDTAFPSYATICEETGISRNTAVKAVAALVASRHISVEQRFRKGERTSNLYTLLSVVVQDVNTQDVVVQEMNNPGEQVNNVVPAVTKVVHETNNNHTHEPELLNQNKEPEPPLSLARHSPKGERVPSHTIKMDRKPDEISAMLRAGLKNEAKQR